MVLIPRTKGRIKMYTSLRNLKRRSLHSEAENGSPVRKKGKNSETEAAVKQRGRAQGLAVQENNSRRIRESESPDDKKFLKLNECQIVLKKLNCDVGLPYASEKQKKDVQKYHSNTNQKGTTKSSGRKRGASFRKQKDAVQKENDHNGFNVEELKENYGLCDCSVVLKREITITGTTAKKGDGKSSKKQTRNKNLDTTNSGILADTNPVSPMSRSLRGRKSLLPYAGGSYENTLKAKKKATNKNVQVLSRRQNDDSYTEDISNGIAGEDDFQSLEKNVSDENKKTSNSFSERRRRYQQTTNRFSPLGKKARPIPAMKECKVLLQRIAAVKSAAPNKRKRKEVAKIQDDSEDEEIGESKVEALDKDWVASDSSDNNDVASSDCSNKSSDTSNKSDVDEEPAASDCSSEVPYHRKYDVDRMWIPPPESPKKGSLHESSEEELPTTDSSSDESCNNLADVDRKRFPSRSPKKGSLDKNPDDILPTSDSSSDESHNKKADLDKEWIPSGSHKKIFLDKSSEDESEKSSSEASYKSCLS